MVTIVGNTYPVKEQIKALGGRWNSEKKGWDVENDKEAEVRGLLTNIVVSRTPKMRKYECEDCGDLVWSGTTCWKTGIKH